MAGLVCGGLVDWNVAALTIRIRLFGNFLGGVTPKDFSVRILPWCVSRMDWG